MPGSEPADSRRLYALLAWNASQEGRPPRGPLPDYTWPLRVPIDELRRIVARDLHEAAELARAHFPTWK